jgi:xanthine/uracil permease
MFFLCLFFLSTTLLGLAAISLACRPFSRGFSNPAAMYYGAVAAGCSLTIFFINLVSYAIPFAWSVVLGHVLGFLVVFFCWWGSKGFREEARKGWAHLRKFLPTIPRLPMSPVWWAVVLTLALVACTKLFFVTSDFRAHRDDCPRELSRHVSLRAG